MNATIYHAEQDCAAIFTEVDGEQHDLGVLNRHPDTSADEWRELLTLVDQADIIRDAARDVVAAWGSRRLDDAVRHLACILDGATEIEIGGTR